MKFQIIVDIRDKNVPISNSYKEIMGYHDRTEQECIDYITWALEKKLNGFKIDTITRVKDSNKNENDDQEGCYCPIMHTLCDYNYEEDCQEGCMQIKNNEEKEFIQFIEELRKENEDLEDFVFEQEIHYQEHFHEFYTSFYKTCSEMLQNGCDLSNKQLAIIEREKRIKGA